MPTAQGPGGGPQGSLRTFERATRTLEIEVLDVSPALVRMRERDGREHADLYFVHDAHLNVYGNALFGRALAEVLAPAPASDG